jgi:hypothetical protein
MKKLLLLCVSMLAVVTAYGQNRVALANTSTTLITQTNQQTGATGNISGAGNFRFGLYVGDVGTAEGSLQLVGLGTNTALAGRFSGGNPFAISAPLGDGRQLTFQVRGWSLAAGSTYEQAAAAAVNNADVNIFFGVSSLGTVTPTASPNPAAALFGTGAGQIGGFQLTNVPEPSSIALGLLGLGAIALFRRRK